MKIRTVSPPLKKANFHCSFSQWSLLNALFSKKIELAPIAAEISCYMILTIDCKAREDVFAITNERTLPEKAETINWLNSKQNWTIRFLLHLIFICTYTSNHFTISSCRLYNSSFLLFIAFWLIWNGLSYNLIIMGCRLQGRQDHIGIHI